MAKIIIQDVDDKTFLFNEDIKAKAYKVFATGNSLAIVADGVKTQNLINKAHFKSITIKDTLGVVIIDGSDGVSTVKDIVIALNKIVNFNTGSAVVVPSNLIFKNDNERDSYFNPLNLSEIKKGLKIIIDDGENEKLVQVWLGTDNPSVYEETNWSNTGEIGITPEQLILINSLSETDDGVFLIKKEGVYKNASVKETETEVRFSKRAVFQANSANIGSVKISNAGQGLVLQNDVTKQRTLPLSQAYDDIGFQEPFAFSTKEKITSFIVQEGDSDVMTDNTEINYKQTLSIDVQLMFAQLKPVDLPVTDSFAYVVKLSEDSEPIYEETVNPEDLTYIDSEIIEFKVSNASQFLKGQTAHITIDGIKLKGSNNIVDKNTPSGVLNGDPDKNNFFPYLATRSIPLIKNTIVNKNDLKRVNILTEKESDVTENSINIVGSELGTGTRILKVKSEVERFSVLDKDFDSEANNIEIKKDLSDHEGYTELNTGLLVLKKIYIKNIEVKENAAVGGTNFAVIGYERGGDGNIASGNGYQFYYSKTLLKWRFSLKHEDVLLPYNSLHIPEDGESMDMLIEYRPTEIFIKTTRNNEDKTYSISTTDYSPPYISRIALWDRAEAYSFINIEDVNYNKDSSSDLVIDTIKNNGAYCNYYKVGDNYIKKHILTESLLSNQFVKKNGLLEVSSNMFGMSREPVFRLDSLQNGINGNPGEATIESLVFYANWEGEKSFRVILNGQLSSDSLNTMQNIQGGSIKMLNYNITEAEWNSIYLQNSSELTYRVEELKNTGWTSVYESKTFL